MLFPKLPLFFPTPAITGMEHVVEEEAISGC